MSLKTLTVIAAMAVGMIAFSDRANAQVITAYSTGPSYYPGAVTTSYYSPAASWSYYTTPYISGYNYTTPYYYSGYYGTPYYSSYYSYPYYSNYYFIGPRRWWWRY